MLMNTQILHKNYISSTHHAQIIKLLGAEPRGIVGTRFARTIVGRRQTALTFVPPSRRENVRIRTFSSPLGVIKLADTSLNWVCGIDGTSAFFKLLN